jgi:RNA-directed DNA polymerase
MTTRGTTSKPFTIEKRLVYEAYKAVKSNKGAAGVDGQTLEQFEADLKGNLYKIWNRMSSGSYFPPPVRAVPIPKKSGGCEIASNIDPSQYLRMSLITRANPQPRWGHR